jgi:hypothetical protein
MENPYEAPLLPSEPGRRFPWKRVFFASVVCAVSCLAIGKTIEMLFQGNRWLPSPAIELYVASGVGLLLSLVTMLVSFIGWRSQSRAGPRDAHLSKK